MQEYPKMLYRGADPVACLEDRVVVADAEGEKIARADGFVMYAEIAAPAVKLVKPRRAKAE